MTTERTKVFFSNRSQAVRLPKAVAFPPQIQEVEITSLGNSHIIAPRGHRWDSWFAGPGVSNDFMSEREQPDDQDREGL